LDGFADCFTYSYTSIAALDAFTCIIVVVVVHSSSFFCPPLFGGGGSGVPVICFSWFYVLYMNLVMGGFYILAKNAILKPVLHFGLIN